MPKAKDMTGQKFGRLTFVRPMEERSKTGGIVWELKCDCGNTHFSTADRITKTKGTRSCGCLYYEVMSNTIEDFHANIRKGEKDECWEWQSAIDKKGYGSFSWEGKRIGAHRFAWGLVNGSIPNGISVCHRCDNHKCVRPDHLFLGTSAKDYTGQRRGILTFIRPTEKRTSKGAVIWEMLCDCGNTTYSPAHKKNRKSCGCLDEERHATFNRKNLGASRRYEPIISSAREIWTVYKDGDIDFDSFYALSQLPCYYCESPPSRTRNRATAGRGKASERQIKEGNFTYNGLDRIDSTKGHTLDNVVPCCWRCNIAKRDMTQEEFFAHIERMYAGIQKYRK
jgi:hypothetical protein